jgi:hypothetical protein
MPALASVIFHGRRDFEVIGAGSLRKFGKESREIGIGVKDR